MSFSHVFVAIHAKISRLLNARSPHTAPTHQGYFINGQNYRGEGIILNEVFNLVGGAQANEEKRQLPLLRYTEPLPNRIENWKWRERRILSHIGNCFEMETKVTAPEDVFHRKAAETQAVKKKKPISSSVSLGSSKPCSVASRAVSERLKHRKGTTEHRSSEEERGFMSYVNFKSAIG